MIDNDALTQFHRLHQQLQQLAEGRAPNVTDPLGFIIRRPGVAAGYTAHLAAFEAEHIATEEQLRSDTGRLAALQEQAQPLLGSHAANRLAAEVRSLEQRIATAQQTSDAIRAQIPTTDLVSAARRGAAAIFPQLLVNGAQRTIGELTGLIRGDTRPMTAASRIVELLDRYRSAVRIAEEFTGAAMHAPAIEFPPEAAWRTVAEGLLPMLVSAPAPTAPRSGILGRVREAFAS